MRGTRSSTRTAVRLWRRAGKSTSAVSEKVSAPAGTSVLLSDRLASHSVDGSGGVVTSSRRRP